MYKKALLAAVAGLASAGPYYDYSQQGANWGDTEEQCNGKRQSPIALDSKMETTDYAADEFHKNYENLLGQQVEWLKKPWTV